MYSNKNLTGMVIHLSNNKTIGEIQEEFSEYFPFLKLGFFTKTHKPYEGSSKNGMLHPDSEIHLLKVEKAKVKISEDMTVSELEQMFKTKFGLNVQVFRKSGKSWLETTFTDNWTLKKQNEEGRELSDLSF